MIKNKETTLGIYLHIPFCVKKCNYCDFLSAPSEETERESYVNALLKEIEYYAAYHYSADTVFFGGGTPSLLEAGQIERLMAALKKAFFICPEAEITMEMNPETVSEKKLRAAGKAGVNRLSFGLQSASDEELKILGRIHTYERFLESYCLARDMGFQNINIDLMSALPGQTEASWEATLQKIAALNPEHISAYSLIIEEGTVFYEKKDSLCLPSEEAECRMYGQTGVLLKEMGYNRYEISNYAREGFSCRHNLKYWSRAPYLGLGLGASSLLFETRFTNTADMGKYKAYCSNPLSFRENTETLTRNQQIEEYLFLGLRKTAGISLEDFQQKFGVPLNDIYAGTLKKLQKQNLVVLTESSLRLTAFGVDVSNQVLAEFLLD